MTKAFLNLPKKSMSFESRRFPLRPFVSMAYKTDAESAAERTAFMTEMSTQFKAELEKRGFVDKAGAEALVAAKMEDFKGIPLEALRSAFTAGEDGKPSIMKTIAEQGAKLLELENRGKGDDNQPLSIRAQVKEWATSNKTALEALAGGTKADLSPLEIRVASPMTPANTYNGSAYLPKIEYLPGVNEIVRVQPTFWDYLRKGTRSTAALVWVNKKNPLGAAAFIGPGVAKPGISFEIETQTSNAKKIAASEKVATELLQDIDGFASWIEMELSYQVRQKANTTLMTGTASSTVPAGIQTLSVAFTATGIATTNPNNWDALIACVAQLRSGNLMGAVTAFLNPIDYANMKLTKAISQGQPFIAPDPGVTIVEDNNIPVGYVQVALLDYYKVDIYKGYTVTYGWENDDFTKNLVTVIGEMRIHQYFSQNYTGAFIYDTFANIKTGITAAP